MTQNPIAEDLTATKRTAASTITSAYSILISSHVNPDGDAIGSTLGTALTLQAAGKRVLPINPEPLPWTFQQLPQATLVHTWQALPSFGKPDLWLALDSADEQRLAIPQELHHLLTTVPIIQFDHHITNTHYGHINIIEPTAAACCEQIARFFIDMKFPVTPDAATAFLCGITTDTGSFRYTSVTTDTFRTASDLMRYGGRQSDVGELLSRRRFAETKLWGLTLQTLQSHHNGQIVVAYTTRAMFEAVGLSDEGAEGIVETLRSIEGVDIAITLREETTGAIKISYRTSERVDATILALANGGGGHARAAGCTVPGPLDQARERLIFQASYLLEYGSLPTNETSGASIQ